MDSFLVIIPSNCLDESKPATRKPDLDSDGIVNDRDNKVWRGTYLCQSQGLAASFQAWLTRQRLASVWRTMGSGQLLGGKEDGRAMGMP
jgi:hypothetical protein